jgi:hypothetical protein
MAGAIIAGWFLACAIRQFLPHKVFGRRSTCWIFDPILRITLDGEGNVNEFHTEYKR